jgi:signal transduction histidine kinase
MGAQVLMQSPERLDERRELAISIDRNIERIDRMIRDLLDANRIRVGQRVTLRIEACDMGSIARAVSEELIAANGERFVLTSDDGVRGFWSADEIRRALWNLASNARRLTGAGSKSKARRRQNDLHAGPASRAGPFQPQDDESRPEADYRPPTVH